MIENKSCGERQFKIIDFQKKDFADAIPFPGEYPSMACEIIYLNIYSYFYLGP